MDELNCQKRSNSTPWPSEVDVGFCRGVILTIVLFFIFHLLYAIMDSPMRMIYSFFHKRGITDYKFGKILTLHTQAFILDSLKLAITFVMVQKFAGIRIRTLLSHSSTSLVQSSKWAFIGICLSLPSSVNWWRGNYEDPFMYVWMGTAVSFVGGGLLAPVQEEIVHRGMFFPALLKKGRISAYFFTVLWFVFGHVPSYSELFFHGNIGLNLHNFIVFILIAIIAAHIYESTGNLILCIIFHGAYNLTPPVNAFLSYVIG